MPEPEELLFFVLAGQSNMAGRGALSEVRADEDARIQAYGQADGVWRTARDPLHADKPGKEGVGPGLTFARALLATSPPAAQRIGLIPCAWGGSELARWTSSGDLSAACVRRVRAALAAGRGRLAGLLWHQGESDAGSAASAVAYAEALPRALADLRVALGAPTLPLVVGEIGKFLNTSDGRFARAADVNAAINRLPQQLAACAAVGSDGLAAQSCRVHFDADSADELGRRYARAWASLTAAEPARVDHPEGACVGEATRGELELDGTSGGPRTLGAWEAGCAAAVDDALATWPTLRTTPSGARVHSGFARGGTGVRSMLWVQEFDAADGTCAGGGLGGAELRSRLGELLGPIAAAARHAAGWDHTFAGAAALCMPAARTELVRWNFDAPPLARREILYLLASSELRGGGALYAYPSVSDAWARDHAGVQPSGGAADGGGRRVRAANLYPSCDVLTPLPDGRWRLAHLITTRLGGWVPDVAYSHLLARSLVGVYANEAEALRRYALKPGAADAADAGESAAQTRYAEPDGL